jgi:hypothetical protein
MALAGIHYEEVGSLEKLGVVKFTIAFNINSIPEIFKYTIGWLSGTDADVLQQSTVENDIYAVMEEFKEKT